MANKKLTPNKKPLKNNYDLLRRRYKFEAYDRKGKEKAPSGPACSYDEYAGGALETEINRQHNLSYTFKLSDTPHWITKEQNEAIWFHAGRANMAGHPISMATCDIPLHSKYVYSNEFLEQRTGLLGLLILPMFNKWKEHDHYFIDIENTYVSVSQDRPYYASNVNIEALEIWEQVSMSSITEISYAMCKPRLSLVPA